MCKNFSGQILLTDHNKLKDPVKAIKKLIKNSIFILRREHNLDLNKLKELRSLCRKQKIYFFVQEIKLAYLLKADGLSIKEHDLASPRANLQKKFYIIASCHNFRAAKLAEKNKDNYILYSPIFDSSSHRNIRGLGRIKFNIQTRFLRSKIVALGGIKQKNISLLNNLNICGFAAIDYFVS
jgi:thiamine-phosphate pyrophosphorylase